MTKPEVLIGEEIREMTDEEAANYLQVVTSNADPVE
jgi:hypothetical protein